MVRPPRIPAAWVRRQDVLLRAVDAGHSGTIAQLNEFVTEVDGARSKGVLLDQQWLS